MRFSVLGSGSRGNATLVSAGTTTILIDAGFSAREITRRLAAIGRDPSAIAAILLTHEHRDHVSGAGVLSRALRCPLHGNVATCRAAEHIIGRPHGIQEFDTGQEFAVGDLQIHPFSISHDCADPVGYVIEDGTSVFGYLTDTGRLTRLMYHHLRRCQALVLESNHDLGLLRDGPYPPPLQQRVQSSRGHLANGEAAAFLAELAGAALSQVVLAHLSEVNNRPDLALAEARAALADCERAPRLLVAAQGVPTAFLELEPERL
ncbi:MAG: MBL fold metallo-hydrolase [Desulfobulbaceae bacterium A2]|nr:MAG: MBL fold metallo-hydrolase [Desulfobulbaceae bacterium A2]